MTGEKHMKKIGPDASANEPATFTLGEILQSNDIGLVRAGAARLMNMNQREAAILCLRRLVELDQTDLDSRYQIALLLDDGSHKSWAESRNILLQILDEHPEIFDRKTETNLNLIRTAAMRCKFVGPVDKAIELFSKLAPLSNKAEDYFLLSEVLAQHDNLAESVAALEKAMALDPGVYDTDANRETLRLGQAGLQNKGAPLPKTGKKTIGRYPLTKDFLGDLQSLIKNHIACDLNSEEKFILKSTRFFTMGSCFARNISRSLNQQGYVSNHMEISEHINTTFANRAFVDMLSDSGIRNANSERIRELLPPHWDAGTTLEAMRASDVFILTLGVAPAFFDRATGAFVLPRPSGLNSRVLAEKYRFRTTTVQENVDNVLYLIAFIRRLSPQIKIVLTVSPVPMRASFEFESCVAADCLSKSTMRLVAHEVVNNSNLENIIYWPSFEIFRWAGSNSSDYYAADDGASWHVSEDKVDETVKSFINLFSPTFGS